MLRIIHSFLDIFFKDTPEKALKRQIKKTLKIIHSLSPPILKKDDQYLTVDFVKFLYQAMFPLLPVFKLLKIELQEKQGVPYTALLIDRHLKEEQIQILNELEEENVKRDILNYEKDQYLKLVEEDFKKYFGVFSESTKTFIRNNFNQLAILTNITKIEIKNFFKEFDPNFKGDNPFYTPYFSQKPGHIFIDDLEILNQILISLEFNDELLSHLKFFVKAKNIVNINDEKIKAFITSFNELKKAGSLILSLQVLKQDFSYFPDPIASNRPVFKTYMERLINNKKVMIEKCFQSILTNNIEKFMHNLFDKRPRQYLEYYNQEFNNNLSRNHLKTFKYVKHMEFIKSFFILKYNDSLQDTISQIIVKGKFNNSEVQKTLGDCYHELKNLFLKIDAHDRSLESSNEFGSKYRRLFLSLGSDKKTPLIINDVTEKLDGEIRNLIESIVINFKNVLSCAEKITDSYSQKNKRILYNILEFDGNKTQMVINKLAKFQKDIISFMSILKLLPN